MYIQGIKYQHYAITMYLIEFYLVIMIIFGEIMECIILYTYVCVHDQLISLYHIHVLAVIYL